MRNGWQKPVLAILFLIQGGVKMEWTWSKWVGWVLLMGVFVMGPVQAEETIEMSTYIPAPGASGNPFDRLHANRATIGSQPPLSFSLTNPAEPNPLDGTLLVAGNVGIGTAAPAAKFHVVGAGAGSQNLARFFVPGLAGTGTLTDIYVGKTATDGGAIVFGYRNSPSPGIGPPTPGNEGGYMTVFGDVVGTSSGGIFVRKGGNVGIGTISPGIAKTYVSNDGTNVGLYVGNGTPFGQAKIELDGPAATHLWAAENGGRVFSVTSGGVGYFFGNVGIGTATPTASLHTLRMATDGQYHFKLDRSGGGSLAPATYGLSIVGSPGAFIIDNLTGVPRRDITLAGNGDVGIGTASPGHKLHVIGDIYANANGLTANGLTVGYNGVVPQGPHVGGAIIAGNVGIGLPVPNTTFTDPRGQTAKLNVYGAINTYFPGLHQIMMSAVFPTYLEYCIDGNYYGVNMFASAKRFKTHITNLELDSGKIYDLRPVSFNWIAERGGKRDFGLIAEEVEKVSPLLVNYDGEKKAFSVKYELLSVLLLNELKQKNIEISILKEEMEQFKARLTKLEQSVR